jgi:hypothetical protein
MRDCPACRVPLHGYEDVCPSCGTKQIPSRSQRGPYGTNYKFEQPGVNWMPFILAFVGLAVVVVIGMNSSWIGQLMRGENKPPDDPIANMNYMEARNLVDAELNKNLQAAGATNTTLTWRSTANSAAAEPGAPPTDDKAVDGPIELTIDTKLPSKDLIKQVVDPIKPYMEPAKIYVLNVNDSASRAHRTYNLSEGASTPSPNAGME